MASAHFDVKAATIEVDHVLLFCGVGAPEADALLGRGIHEGPGNSHPGQGTVNRRFFFPNLYLELLWVENYEEATRPEPLRTGLWERWSNRDQGVCPFALILRPGAEPGPELDPKLNQVPFDSWTYVPRYFPPGFSIEVAKDIPPNEPLLFYLPFARPARVEDVAPMPGGVHIGTICATTLHLPQTASLSPALERLVAQGVVAVEPGREFLVDLEHVLGTNEIMDLRPKLPVRFLPASHVAQPAH